MKEEPFILTFGSCGWDRIIARNEDGSQELIYEEEGRKNSHQAIAAYRAGAKSMLISFVGDDEIGKKVFQSLKDSGLDTTFVTVAKGESTEINHQYYNKITKDYEVERFPSPLSQWYTPDMVEKYSEYILKANYVILVSKQPKDFLSAMINFCYENNIPTVLTVSHEKFDINNPSDLETLKKCTVVTGNFEESAILTGKTTPEEMLEILPNLLITKGEEGVWFLDEGGNVIHEAAVVAIEVVETNGAGDTLIGNFTVFRSEGKSMIESVRMSMCASTLEIGKMGVLGSMPYRAETEELYKNYYQVIKKT